MATAEYHRQWRLLHPLTPEQKAVKAARDRARRIAKRDPLREQKRAYRKAHPEMQREHKKRQRRARRRARWKPVKTPRQMALPLWPEGVTDPRVVTAMKVARREARTEYERLRTNARRRAPRGWAVQAWKRLQKRSYELGTPFDLLPDDLIPPAVCPVFGTAFVYGSMTDPAAPTADKLLPALGYVKGNVHVISRRANQIKSDCTSSEEIRRVADWLDKIFPKTKTEN